MAALRGESVKRESEDQVEQLGAINLIMNGR